MSVKNRLAVHAQKSNKEHIIPIIILILIGIAIALAMALFFVHIYETNETIQMMVLFEDEQSGNEEYLYQHFFTGLREIRYEIKNGSVAGKYTLDNRTIHIYDVIYPQPTLYHELGHHVWHYLMTEQQQQTYKEYRVERETWISNYSLKDVSENFAEDFKCYYYNQKIYRVFDVNNGTILLNRQAICREELPATVKELMVEIQNPASLKHATINMGGITMFGVTTN